MTMQRKTIVIARLDGSVGRFPLRPKTEMRFERTYKVGLANDATFSGPEGATLMYKLAWEAERDNGHVVKGFDEWANEIEAVDVAIEEIVPFENAAPAGESPSSPSPPG